VAIIGLGGGADLRDNPTSLARLLATLAPVFCRKLFGRVGAPIRALATVAVEVKRVASYDHGFLGFVTRSLPC
jgi:hypothetical protein